jgi:hypothetical protein
MDMVLHPPPLPEGVNPRLSTLREVQQILATAAEAGEGALSYGEIGRRMSAKKTRPEVVRACVEELVFNRQAAVGPQGVVWMLAEPAVWKRDYEPLA